MHEMEEKLQTYDHGTKLDLLAQLLVNKEKGKEISTLEERPPPLKTLNYHTTMSLGH
jgi:hypothetical protein